MAKEKITKENLYVYYDSLISISCLSETGSYLYSQYLLRIENLEQTLLLKKCQVPLSDFSDLKESLFFIKEYEENKKNKKKVINKNNSDNNLNKEKEENIQKKRVNYNQKFILQHMMSKNYICVENIPGNNNYNLKLTNDKNSAVPFILERIHENRASQEFLTFKQSFYIKIHLKEKEQYFYINSSSYLKEKEHNLYIDRGSYLKEKTNKYDIDSSYNRRSQNNFNFITNENIIGNQNTQTQNTNIINNNDKDNDSENNFVNFFKTYSEINIEKKTNSKYLFVNQSWYIKNKENLFASQVVNIIFINSNLYKDSYKNNQITEREEQYMLSAEFVDNTNEEEVFDSNQEPEDTNFDKFMYHQKTDSNFYDINKGLITQIRKKDQNRLSQQTKVKIIPYEKELYKHVINNCFWVIEEENNDYREKLKKNPLKVKSQIKIKNVLLGLYLNVKKKGNNIRKSNSINNNIENDFNENNEESNNQENQKIKLENDEENEYEFHLVDEETLVSNSFFLSNFKIFHYNMNKKMKFMDFKGKIALRTIFKDKSEHFDFQELNKYFQPLSINIDIEKKYSLLMKNEDDFIFEIRKVDIFEANHVIYIKKIIQNLNLFLKKCKNNEIEVNNSIKVISLNISFFVNYLLNIEYIFRDEQYDVNIPIEQRQLILENFGIIKTITKIAEYLLSIIEQIKYRRNLNDGQQNYLKNITITMYQYKTLNEKLNASNNNITETQKVIKTILEFLTFLFKDNEEIKEKIFLDLDIILELAENLFVLDRSILLNFIFKLIDNSEVLQEYVTGGKLNLISSIKNSLGYNNYTIKENKNKLIRMDRILKYIETTHNYIYYYKKLLSLNKVKHKEEKIKLLISQHMRKIDSEYNIKYNYKRYLIDIIKKSRMIIKRIEEPLIKNAKTKDLMAEKELNSTKLRDPLATKKIFSARESKISTKSKEVKFADKNNSESGYFLNKNTLDEKLNLDKNIQKEDEEKKKIQEIDNNLKTNNNGILRKSILKNKNTVKKEKKGGWKNKIIKNAAKILTNLLGRKKEEDESVSVNFLSKNATKEEKIEQKLKIEQSLHNIKAFLNFFENFDINNTLFVKDKVFNELFNSLDEAKNSKSKLSYVVNGDTKSIQLMDGIKLDPESELGQLIPFHLFNRYFPKFRSQNSNIIIENNNYLDPINEDENLDEDSENEIYNFNINEKNNYIKNNKINNKNILTNNLNQNLFLKNKDYDLIKRGESEKVQNKFHFDLKNRNTLNFSTMNNNNNNINNNKHLRLSKTKTLSHSGKFRNNLNLEEDEHLIAEIEQKKIEKYLKKLNKYLCILYTIYQFCINQYYDTFHKVFKILNNYFINYNSFCKMDIFKNNMEKIKDALISKIAFLDNDVLENLYLSAKEEPTLLTGVFDIDNFIEGYSEEESERLENQNNNLEYSLEDEQQYRNYNRRDKKGFKIKELTQEEITLIKALFYFCNKYDRINYMKDKIKYLQIIKNNLTPQNKNDSNYPNTDLTNNMKMNLIKHENTQFNDFINSSNKKDIYNEKLYNILEELYIKKNKILEAYIDIHECKKDLADSIKRQQDRNSKSVISLGYDIDKRFNIIVKLLMDYEIDNIFGKLIYIDINKNSIYFDYNILRNLKIVQSTFKEIDDLIKKIRIDYDRRGDNYIKIVRDKNNNIINQINANNSNFNKEYFQRINYCLSKMTVNFLNFLNINSNNIINLMDMPKISQMLYKENENFYKKIGFDKTFENLIQSIDFFYDFDNNPMIKLQYCQEILRIFIDVQSIYKNFKENIPEYFELYYNMIMKSLHSISLYKIDKIGDPEEKTFLKISYYSCESFILIIFNSKKNFNELRPFMIDILTKLLKIYSRLKNAKNRIIFQILYTYYISRVLLFISKEKYFDDFSYNSFFQIVYPMEKMHEQILNCVDEISKDEDTDTSSEEEMKTEEDNINEGNKIDEEKEEDVKSNKTPLFKNPLIENNDNFNYYHNNKYYNNFLKKQALLKKMKSTNNIKQEEHLKTSIIPQNTHQDFILWESEEEKEKLSFYLNYFSIYVLYLHDRNSIKKIRDNMNKENNINIIDYDFKNLYSKIQKLLDDSTFTRSIFEQDTKNQIDALNINNNNISNNLKYNLNRIKLSILNNQESNNTKIKNNFQFESVLIEAIILYKYNIKEQNVEIPVKNYKTNKIKEPNLSNDTADGDKTSMNSNNMVKLRTNNLINFYYYDNEYLDLIFLEKICNDIHISENINYYCTNKNFEFNEDNIYENLLKKILLMKKEFKLITSYYKGEYDKLHDQYINNDMEEFILLLKNRFTNNDFNRIYSMKKFLYKRMNEIYSEDLFSSEYYNNKKILSFIEEFKLIENKEINLELLFKNISLCLYLTSLVYIYPEYPKKTCILYYKIGFQLLAQRFAKNIDNNHRKMGSNEIQTYLDEKLKSYQGFSMRESKTFTQNKQQTLEQKHVDYDDIINGLILIFSREANRKIIQDDEEVFFTMINSLILFLKEIKENNLYLKKRGDKIRRLFTELDFAFDHLFQDFEKIANFMKSAENQKLKDKYRKNEANLKIIIIFITTFLSLQKEGDYNLLTDNIIQLIQNFTGQIIKLVRILIEIGKEDNMKTANMLIDFFYFFIEGPDINNLNSLFAFRFFNLVTFIITRIDYYKIFWNNINNVKLHNIMDSFAKIEQKILKIFFIYYNVSYNNNKNVKEYIRIRDWYEKNYEYIKIKLKKLYFFSKVEMEKRIFDIDKALIYKKKNDSYTDEELFLRAGILNRYELNQMTFGEKLNLMLSEKYYNEIPNEIDYMNNNYNYNWKSENINEERMNNFENDIDLMYNNYKLNKINYCLIKFDLILIYYTLNVYYRDIINEEYVEINTPTDSFLENVALFFKKLFFFIIDVICCIYDLIRYLYRHVSEKAKSNVDLLQELNKIDEDCLTINEKDMFLDLSSKIKCVEISIDQILYKIYFPIIDKAKKIEENTEYYLYVSNDYLHNYISYIISNYDKIHISVTKNFYFDKLSEIPVVNLMFKNIHLFGIMLMIIGIVANLLILLSYSTFTNDAECNCGHNQSCLGEKRRLFCPRFLYDNNRNYLPIKRALNIFGLLQLIFQIMVIFDFIFRNFSINWALTKNKLKIKKARILHQYNNIAITNCEYIKIILRTIWSLITFQFIYYVLYIIFVLLGYLKHPFFYGFTLLEIVNRVELMAAVLKSLYVPKLYLLINLLMFIMLEYFFSFFALSFFTSHFPNIKDTKNFLQTFMRMLDQTFKQDGGIGTYLDQSLDPEYVQYSPKAYAGPRFWFDFLFYFFTILLIFQMFTSIIFDYFMNTRKNKESFAKKSKTECLICGLERENLEKIYMNAKDAFQKHTYHCHNIRNYINYLFYLQSLSYRDPIIEENVWNYHLDNKNSYLPDKTCFTLKEKNVLENIKMKNLNN